MRVPINWLKEYIDIDISAAEVADKLTRAGLEVEGVNPLVSGLDGVVVAEINDYKKHPSADKLWVVKVSTGNEEHQVVAGIQNYNIGDKVPLALPGTNLLAGTIKRTEIRGLVSNGMLCSAEELGLQLVVEDGILILDKNCTLGADITEALGLDDDILEIGLTPNRADCLGMLGVALEIGALTNSEAKFPVTLTKYEAREAENFIDIQIKDLDLCSRYTARILEEIEIAPSPLELQIKLLQAGLRPINNVVDVSNYVMWETGQPLHTFDYYRIKGKKIIVRRALKGETIRTLDDQERKLTPDMLVIADEESPIALAGVMGGLDSEITKTTKTVLLESAHFNPVSIRRTAREVGLTSEASFRFEKGVDIGGTLFAANRAALLLEKYTGAKTVSGVVDVYPEPHKDKIISLNPQKVSDVLGLNLEDKIMEEIFIRLGLEVKKNDDKYFVTVPSRRRDLTEEIDLVEEVARVYGFEHIGTTLPEGKITQGKTNIAQKNTDKIKSYLTGEGLFEAITFAFMNKNVFDSFLVSEGNKLREAIPLKNPLSEEQGILRTTLLPNLLDVVKYNLNRHQEDISIFEMGKTFRPEKMPLLMQPNEHLILSMMVTGKRQQKHWQETPQEGNFYWLKGLVADVLKILIEKQPIFKAAKISYLHPTQGAEININNKKIGVIGTIHPVILDNYGIKQTVYTAEINLSLLIDNESIVRFKPLPKYPAINRDLAIVVPINTEADAVARKIKDVAGDIIEDILLFDVYQGKQVPVGFKSLAYTIVYRDYNETLRDERINEVQEQIISILDKELGAVLRS